MAETSKKIDPDATITQPLAALDPDATVAQMLAGVDPDATVSPTEHRSLDLDLTVRMPNPAKARDNPFAPKSLRETLEADFASLGGLNPLIAMANPILGAVPQIRRSLRHPDPAMLRASLREQIESLQTSAMFADIPDAVVEPAVYALCALLDESAAATPWGVSWAENGLLKELRGETGGGEGFFKLLERIPAEQSPQNEADADLLEFFYVCLALGFEGRYRGSENGQQALERVRSGLYAAVSRRRPRPLDGLSPHWRSAVPPAAATAALQIATEVSSKISMQAAERVRAAASIRGPDRAKLFSLPRRDVWGVLAAFVGALIVIYLLAMRLLEDETTRALTSRPASDGKAAHSASLAPPAASTARAVLADALQGEELTITAQAGGVTIALRSERQFAPGSARPSPELRPLLRKIAAALGRTPGPILISGHADALPTRNSRYPSNGELSVARARAVSRIMAPAFADPKRIDAEGKGESEPLAPNDSDTNRAKNRRVMIVLKPAP